MNVEKIITNDEFKIVFLKAIILGINYGEKDEVEKYKNTIENEIIITTEKLNNNSKENNKDLEQTIHQSYSESLEESTNNQTKILNNSYPNLHEIDRTYLNDGVFRKLQTPASPLTGQALQGSAESIRRTNEEIIPSGSLAQAPDSARNHAQAPDFWRNKNNNNNNNNINTIPSNPAINHSIYLINKHENDIQNLENQKNSIFYLIESLSKTNYTFNYSKINLLRNSLSSINQEINRHHISILREKNNQKILIKNSRYQQFEQRDLYNKFKQQNQIQQNQMQQQFFFRR